MDIPGQYHHKALRNCQSHELERIELVSELSWGKVK